IFKLAYVEGQSGTANKEKYDKMLQGFLQSDVPRLHVLKNISKFKGQRTIYNYQETKRGTKTLLLRREKGKGRNNGNKIFTRRSSSPFGANCNYDTCDATHQLLIQVGVQDIQCTQPGSKSKRGLQEGSNKINQLNHEQESETTKKESLFPKGQGSVAAQEHFP
ncbi:hypothetical protein Leryth_002975, partial [Lithospermum erythrorhizon]